jgi:ATP-dependent RNA helicase DeaD
VSIEQRELTVPTVEQWYFETQARMKFEALLRLVDFHGFKLGIIFCNTQRMVDELADSLIAQGFSADRLHGGIAQAQRTRVMNKFKKAEFEFLVATDVAARGIDVDDLELVVNYDLPYDAEDYVHRIGRTGRAGRKGMAVTFVSGREIYKLQFIERFTKTKIRRGTIPTHSEVEEKRSDVLLDRVREVLAAGKFQKGAPFVERLIEEGFASTDVAAAAIQLLSGGGDPAPESKAASNPASKSDSPKPQTTRSEPVPLALRPPSRGMQWVRVNVGRESRIGPRDIIALLEESLGLPGRTVGIIDLSIGQSFAQVPTQFLDILRPGPRELETGDGRVEISLVGKPAGDSDDKRSKFKPKPSGRGKPFRER